MGEAVDRLELKLSMIGAFKRRLHSGKVVQVSPYERQQAAWAKEKATKSVEQLNKEFDDDMEGVPFRSAPVPGSHPALPVHADDVKGFEKHVNDPTRVKDDPDHEEHLRQLLKKVKAGGALTKAEARDVRMYGGGYGPVDSY